MLGQSSLFKFILFGIFVCGIGVVILNFVSYGRRKSDYDLLKIESSSVLTPNGRSGEASVRKTNGKLNNNKSSKGTDKNVDTLNMSIRTFKIVLNDEKYDNVVVREAGEGDNHVLLLHGRQSSSEIWKRTGILQHIASLGYRAYAIDIPYSGNDSIAVAGNKAAVQWLTKVINKLRLSNLVIVSPSLSGQLTLPYMFQLKNDQNLVKGFVYIAPVGTKHYEVADFKQIKFPTLIVHGEKDKEFQSAFQILKNIPNSIALLMKDASHSSYVDKPAEFRQELRKFLQKVYQTNYKTVAKSLKKTLSLSSRSTRSPNKRKQ